MKSYSDAVQKSKGKNVTLSKIKTVVKDIVEDRSRNIMIFGTEETNKENLQNRIMEVFEELDEKPFFRAEKVGRKVDNDKSRPVKVTMDNSVVVSELLRKSRDLKKSQDHSAVYLKPDRTLDQRRKHRQLVNELKQCIIDSPNQCHFIRNGEICDEETGQTETADVPEKSASIGPGVAKKKEKVRKYFCPITPQQTDVHHVATYSHLQQTRQITTDNLKSGSPMNIISGY